MSFVSQLSENRNNQKVRTVLVVEDIKGKRIINLDKNIYSLGRSSSNSIVIQSPLVSRHHATLFRVANPENKEYLFHIMDGDLQGSYSSNGLVINGVKCFKHLLAHKDLIVFGGNAKAIYLVIDSDLSDTEILLYGQPSNVVDKSIASFDACETLVPSDVHGEPLSEAALLRLASFPELLPNPIIEIDLSGKITYLNPAALLKFPEIQKMGLSHSILAGLIDAVQNQKKQSIVRDVEVGSDIFEQSVHYIAESRLIRSYLVDITERKRTEEALRQSEERYALAAKAANDGLWDWNIKNNEIYFSSRWKSIIGFEENEIGNSPSEWFNRVHPDEIERVKVEIVTHIEGITAHFESEYRMLHKDGTYRWMRSQGIAVKDNKGKAYRMVGSQTDINSRKLAETQLLYDAFHDALTGLSNRALFMNRLEHVVEIAKRRQDYLFAVLFLDLDRFKFVNDSLGHHNGDLLLVAFVERLLNQVRSGDTVARLGGDEFAILVEDIKSINDAKDVAERIQKQLASPFNLNSHEVFTSVSIGIAFSTTSYNTPDELLRNADIAMYRAKALGKARYQIFDPSMYTWALALLQLENDLRRAIERQEFMINYQPIVEVATGTINGFEALIRWQHPERGLVSPGEFIPVAEDTGLIVSIGYWVMREACRQLAIWQQRFKSNPPLTMSVNLSGKQFREVDLLEQIQIILLETAIEPSTLKLEITESAIVENPEATVATLMQLRNLGVQIYIDDFGTGYSSLSYLHRFPFDALKIDRSFISRMCTEREGEEIVQTIINLARNLNVYIVAEGVETQEQWELLKQINSNAGLAQGYLFSKPLASAAVEALMAKED
ncbi:MAG TPA: EAL domain-containing protein [Candidatus Obscuribacterales bacterium]